MHVVQLRTHSNLVVPEHSAFDGIDPRPDKIRRALSEALQFELEKLYRHERTAIKVVERQLIPQDFQMESWAWSGQAIELQVPADTMIGVYAVRVDPSCTIYERAGRLTLTVGGVRTTMVNLAGLYIPAEAIEEGRRRRFIYQSTGYLQSPVLATPQDLFTLLARGSAPYLEPVGLVLERNGANISA